MRKESAHANLGLCCLRNQTKGMKHEQIQEIMAHDLVLGTCGKPAEAGAPDVFGE
jgi:hypothetical protein